MGRMREVSEIDILRYSKTKEREVRSHPLASFILYIEQLRMIASYSLSWHRAFAW